MSLKVEILHITNSSPKASRKKLACYFPCSDPDFPREILDSYVDCGVDIIELGLPCEDPYADGPLVGSSMKRAYMADPFSLGVKDIVSHIKASSKSVRVVLMGYESYARDCNALEQIKSDIESPRVCRRLIFLRGLADEQTTWILPRSA